MSFTESVLDMQVTDPDSGRSTSSGRLEWPTMAIGATIVGGWLATTRFHGALPTPVTIALLGWLLAWSSSFQHEILHGHPTPWRWLNDAVGRITFELWLPYDHYKRTHLRHHRDDFLTDPIDDPESKYVAGRRWEEIGPTLRMLLRVNRTLVGRLLIGPWLTVSAYLIGQFNELIAGVGKPGEGDPRSRWAIHVPYVAVTVAWLMMNHVVWWHYAMAVWMAQALIQLRSFAEHRWMPDGVGRSASVASRGPLALLFLNNNLHTAHHRRMNLAWYRLPAFARRIDAPTIAAAGAGSFVGYGDLFRRYAFQPIDDAVFPPDLDLAPDTLVVA
jgi:fatty acid desaturase